MLQLGICSGEITGSADLHKDVPLTSPA